MSLMQMATDCHRAVHAGQWVADYIVNRLTNLDYQKHPSLAHDEMAYRQARTAARYGNSVLDYLAKSPDEEPR